MASAILAEYCLPSIPGKALQVENLLNPENVKSKFNKLPPSLQRPLKQIIIHIKNDILDPIYKSANDDYLIIQFDEHIRRFQKLNFQIIELIKQASLLKEVVNFDLTLFTDLEARLKDNKSLDINTRDNIMEIIHLLRQYEIQMRDLVLHRKYELEGALGQIAIDDFLKRIYGPYLVLTCAYLSLYPKLNVKLYYHYRPLMVIAKQGRMLAEGLTNHLQKITNLMNGLPQTGPYDILILPSLQNSSSIPDNVKLFMKEIGLGANTELELVQLVEKIDNLLKDRNLQHNISVNLFVDVDDPEWKEIMIVSKIAQRLKRTFNEIEPHVDNILEEHPNKELTDRIFIKYESL